MKRNISKELAISAGIGVLIGILVLSYANNNNFTKLGKADVHGELSALANEILNPTASEISNKGILNSLASKVLAANRALDIEDAETAVQKLNELIAQVTDQTKHIPANEASILIELAESAIYEITGVMPPETLVCTNSDGQTFTLDRTCVESLCRDPTVLYECIEDLGLCNDRICPPA
ncbi:MAG: hypothetical protein KAJ91_00595 [Candidatus Aenigmarchaeota archaeon]|nr:hypothetical protein [Candidatus Aenigmarchaeota archaeon]